MKAKSVKKSGNRKRTTVNKADAHPKFSADSQDTGKVAHKIRAALDAAAQEEAVSLESIGQKYGEALAHKHEIQKQIADLQVELMLTQDQLRIISKRWTDAHQPSLPGVDDGR